MFPLQAVELTPGRARDPAENGCATDDEQNESQQANFDRRPASGDTPEATGGMICYSHTIPFIIISAPNTAKQSICLVRRRLAQTRLRVIWQSLNCARTRGSTANKHEKAGIGSGRRYRRP